MQSRALNLETLLWAWLLTMLGVRLTLELQNYPQWRALALPFTALSLLYAAGLAYEYFLEKNRYRPWLTALALSALALVLAKVYSLGKFGGQLALLPLAIVYLPLAVLSLSRRFPLVAFRPGEWTRGFAYFVAAALLLIPALQLLNHFVYQSWILDYGYRPRPFNADLGLFFARQFFWIALPEELFYRGFLQTALNDYWPKRWRVLGVDLGPGFFWTAGIFALSHSLMQVSWWHFAIVFPALVFGWLREKTGGVFASSLFHALANTYSSWVAHSYGKF